ncbi:DUF2802 domain-containing protein [Alteromonas sediminis]|uniref:DUF2802 domain-containing protein n=1 Tax=Alteromonas sediminis TaxID=2259342 RepID=A0A3N5Y924_9ALTE|nr:DUF2802 domain-containing protein [Alteromonas sediminis]RPJ65025.1 DUF2802 domain-containing protein [Alteromonas sediminis]
MIASSHVLVAAFVLASAALVITVFTLFKLKAVNAMLKQALNQHQTTIDDLTSMCQEAQLRVEESHAALMTLHQSVTPLHQRIESLEGQVREQAPNDPQIKLYQKAATMAQDNASAEEIASACELPFAEAQMLVNLYTPKA